VSPKLIEGKKRDKIKAETNEMENRKIIEKNPKLMKRSTILIKLARFRKE
jgi:hypothetical protein